MIESTRRLLWPIVATAVTLPAAGGGVYYTFFRPEAVPTAESAQSQENSSLDAAAQALAAPQPLQQSDPLAIAANLPATPTAPSGNRYGTIAPVEPDLPYAAPAEMPDYLRSFHPNRLNRMSPGANRQATSQPNRIQIHCATTAVTQRCHRCPIHPRQSHVKR